MKTKEFDKQSRPHKYAQAKADGHFLQVIKKPCGSVECWTRTPTRLDLTFCGWLGTIYERVPPGIIQGELWYPGKRASHVKTAIVERDSALRFSVFAIECLPNDAPLADVHALVTRWGLHYLPWWRANNVPDADWHIAQCELGDAEGIVYKDGNLLNWAKWKPTPTIDLVVTDTVEGKGKFLGMIGALVCSTTEGYEVASVSGMTDAERWELTENSPVGKVVEVAYQYVGSQGRLRHPRFVRMRDDKSRDECEASQEPALLPFLEKWLREGTAKKV